MAPDRANEGEPMDMRPQALVIDGRIRELRADAARARLARATAAPLDSGQSVGRAVVIELRGRPRFHLVARACWPAAPDAGR